jgi:isopenicillin N synthase-like dioxygenase
LNLIIGYCSHYQIPRNGILAFDAFPHPPLLDNNLPLLRRFILTCIGIAQNIFSALSAPLNLPQSHSFDAFHRRDAPAPDIIRLLKYAASQTGDSGDRVPQTPHTDLGSLTMLFADSPGLQIKPDGCDEWLYVEPKEKHAVINLGDAMSLWTDGIFRSVLHRVASLPSRSMNERYSFAFLMRPENQAPMMPLLGPSALTDEKDVLTSEDWIKAKFGILRGDTTRDRNRILTGREAITI